MSKKTDQISKSDSLKIVQTIPPILVTGEPSGNLEYSWNFSPSWKDVLDGSPWDPIEHPRFSAIYDSDKLGQIDPLISAQITCAMEDLIISDLQPKNPAKTLSFDLSREKQLVAEQYVRHYLNSCYLAPGKMDNRFASMLIAYAISVEG